MFGTGDEAPDFTIHSADDHLVSLSGILDEGHPVLLVFLRHLG